MLQFVRTDRRAASEEIADVRAGDLAFNRVGDLVRIHAEPNHGLDATLLDRVVEGGIFSGGLHGGNVIAPSTIKHAERVGLRCLSVRRGVWVAL